METKRFRLESVDVVRGIIMIIMALDHVRDYFSNSGINPTDPATTTIPLFFTRWITHFCAPTFFLLTGTGAYLSLRKKSIGELSRFLWTRGLWLIFLEIVVTRFFWTFNVDYHVTMLIILWALGWAMLSLSVLVRLPVRVVGIIGVVMIATHNLFDGVRSNNPLWTILHSPNILFAWPHGKPEYFVMLGYPLIPWIGVTAAGFALGQVFASPEQGWSAGRRRAFLLRLGAGLTVAFVVLRAINFYGDFSRWSVQATPIRTVLSFLNTSKYPPSLLYLLMTLGPAILLLWAFDYGRPLLFRPALIVGKVPMFYYLLHIPLAHLIAVALCYQRYGAVHWMFEAPNLGSFPVSKPEGWGYGLPVVYLIWASVVVILYPLCVWFAGVKQRNSAAWLSYF